MQFFQEGRQEKFQNYSLKETFFGDAANNKYYYRPTTTIEQVAHGEGTAALQVSFIGQNNHGVNFDLFANNENQFMQAPTGQLQGNEEYQFFGKEGAYFSPNVAINLLDPDKRKFLSSLTQQELNELDSNTMERAGVAGLEAQLSKIEEGRRSPLRASVQTIGGGAGCSGTLVGISGNKAYVLTAAHCGPADKRIYLNKLNAEGKETKFTLENNEGIIGKVVARDNNVDIALLEITPSAEQLRQIQNRGYARIIPQNFQVNQNAPVTAIGCPGANDFFRVSSCGIRSIGVRDDVSPPDPNPRIVTDVNPRGGESGGGLFQGKYLIGVTIKAGGGGANVAPVQIYQFLDKNGYSFLYQFILIFFYDNY